MKKGLRFIAFVVCIIVLIGVYNAVTLAEEKTYIECDPLMGTASIYYVPDSLPKEMQINEWVDYVYLNSEDVKFAYANLLSGDEFLKDALFFKYDNASGHMCVRIDDTELVSPGHAIFEIYCESDHYQTISEFELYVFDYREDELYSEKWPYGMRFDANVGDSFALDELFAKGVKFNLETMMTTKQIREKNINNLYIRYYIPDLCDGISMKYDFWALGNTIHIEDYGVHQFSVQMRYGNYIYTLPVTIVVTEPGKNDSEYNQNPVESVESNQRSNTMVKSGVLDDVLLETMAHDAGFIVPIPEGEEWYIDQEEIKWDGYCVASKHGSYKDIIVYAEALKLKGFMRNPFDEINAIVANAPSEEDARFRHLIKEWITLDDGHPALLCISKHVDNNGMFDSFRGYLYYARNDRLLEVRVFSVPWMPTYNRQVTIEDMKKIASKVSYDESEAPITIADGALSLSSVGEPITVTAGKNVTFTATFANPDRVNKKNANDAIVWSVSKVDTGEAFEGVSIDAKGQLKVDKSLSAPVDLQVKVASELFDTSATYNITAMPVVSKVILDPAELFFYTGTEDAQTVKASLEPVTVPPVGLTWTPAKKDIVEITAIEDGVVSIKPLKAGKTDISVKEPGGKNARLTVNVVAPVESVELKMNGAVKAGGKVKIATQLAPKNAGNKTVKWSVDVGEDIAKIDDKGQLTISKEAPSGTKITVTCTALGAPSPVVSTIVVEIP